MSEAVQEAAVPEPTAAEMEAAILAGYNKENGIESANLALLPAQDLQEEPVVDKPVETKADAAPSTPEPDPLEKRLRNLEGHFGTVNRDLQKISQAMEKMATAQTTAVGAPTPTPAELAAPASQEKTEFLKREYPEWHDAMQEQINAIGTKYLDRESAAKFVDKETLTKTATDTAYDVAAKVRELVKIDRAQGDDWQEKIYSQDFKDWLEQQPAEMKAKRESDFGKDVIHVLDAFDQSRKTPPKVDPPAPRRGQTLQDSVPATTGSGPTRTERAQTMDEAIMAGYKKATGRE